MLERIKLKRLILLLLPFLLAACSHIVPVYHPPVQQGELINSHQVEQLQTGMSPDQVTALLGKPLLVNLFDKNRLVYVYTLKVTRKPRKERQLEVTFINNKMTNFSIKTYGDAEHFET